MYEQIKKDIASDSYSNYANEGQKFVVWYLRNIHNLDPIEAKNCITDGAGDKQIDAIYIDNQTSIIYIIQGKFYSSEKIDSEPLREVLASWVQIKDLEKLQDSANDKLRVKINELSEAIEDNYEICFEFITTSELTDSAKNDLEVFSKELTESEELTASLVLVDKEALKFKYDEAINKSRPYINHIFSLEHGKYMELCIAGTKAIIAAIPLKDCIKIDGIKDGRLFRKNVRQSLGSSNKVNKGIALTLKNSPDNFFFLHNGITAICSKMDLKENTLFLKELNVVNGCQSLSTIYNCAQSIKNNNDGYILFRFYEISDNERADKISTSTNSQSAVKPRDLRSNDKSVLIMKKAYEQFYNDGYFITKRGETVDTAKFNTSHIVNLTDLGKQLVAWHSQRPTISYSESKIFDKYFSQLFHKDYAPKNIQSLNELYKLLISKWTIENPLGLNESLLAMKAYAPYHHLYAISAIALEINKTPEGVPNPSKVLDLLKKNNLTDTVINMSGNCLNMAFENASEEYIENNKIFSPQNWIKAKVSIKKVRESIKTQLSTLKMLPEGLTMLSKLSKGLKLSSSDFEERWTAD